MNIEKTMGNMAEILKSLVIKMEFVAEYMNLQLSTYTTIEIDYDDKSTWMYYMNMAGLKHEANEDVTMKSLDTSEFFIVTKESLLAHPITHIALKEYSVVFDYLCKDNHTQVMYIRGMINPLPMDLILNAKDLSVVWYDKSLISKREDQILPDIEKAISGHMYQWYNTDLTFEDRYVPTMVAQLFSVISLAIINSKLKVVNTENSSDDHITEFMNSSNHTSDIVEYLPEDTKLWVYGNIRRLMRNVGKDATLKEVVEQILVPAGIDVFKLIYEEVKFEETDNSNPYIKPWNMDIVLMLSSMNPDDSKTDIERITEDVYLRMQAEYTDLPDTAQSKEILHNRILSPKNNMQTKSLVMRNTSSNISIGYDSTIMVVENWLIDSLNNKLHSVVTIDPTNDNKFTLSAKDAAYLFLYLALTESGLDTNIKGFNTQLYIHRRDFSNMYRINDSDSHNVIDSIIKNVPPEIITGNIKDYVNHIRTLKLFHTTIRATKDSAGEKLASENVTLLTKFMFHNVVGDSYIPINTSGESQDLQAILKTLTISTQFLNPMEIMDLILKGFTGEPYNKKDIVKTKINIFKNFLKKFISYNLQVLDLPTNEKSNEVLETISLIRGLDAMLIEDIEIDPLGKAMDGELTGFENKLPIRFANEVCSLTEVSNTKRETIFPIMDNNKVFGKVGTKVTIGFMSPKFTTKLHSIYPINSSVSRIIKDTTTTRLYMRDIFVYMKDVNPDRVVTQDSLHITTYIDSPDNNRHLTVKTLDASNSIVIESNNEPISFKDVVGRLHGVEIGVVNITENHKLYIQKIEDTVKVTSVDVGVGNADTPKLETYSLKLSAVDYIDNSFRDYTTGISMKDIVENNTVTIKDEVEIVTSQMGPNVTIK